MTTGALVDSDTITFHGDARKILRNARDAICDARQWATLPSNWQDAYGIDTEGLSPDAYLQALRDQTHKLQERLVQMELSFATALTQVILMDANAEFWPDGSAEDGCLSLTWRAAGLFGGLIFHADYAKQGTTRLPVGTWSLHT